MFILFEPQDDLVLVSAFVPPRRPEALYFPAALFGPDDARPAALYAFVAAERASLLADPGADGFVRLPFPRRLLLDSMARDVPAALDLARALGAPDW